jgi:hypothetical protein
MKLQENSGRSDSVRVESLPGSYLPASSSAAALTIVPLGMLDLMKKFIEVLIVSVLFTLTTSAQSYEPYVHKWRQYILNRDESGQKIFSTFESESLPKTFLQGLDFSSILSQDGKKYLGYIDTAYQRLKVAIDEVKQVSDTEYSIKGRTQVKSNICDFTGTITISDVRKLTNPSLGIDDSLKDSIRMRGLFIADFTITEDKNSSGSGVFKGIMVSRWYINSRDELLYDDTEDYSDRYANNQYLGSWISYKTKAKKKCAWGHRRIPDSGDLDWSAGVFGVNPKYLGNGWISEYLPELLKDTIPDNADKQSEDLNIYSNPDESAVYYGGMQEFQNYLKRRMDYQKKEGTKPLETQLISSFTVEKDGSVSGVYIERYSVDGVIEDAYWRFEIEARRVLSSMSNWKPAVHKSMIVRSRMKVPIQYYP